MVTYRVICCVLDSYFNIIISTDYYDVAISHYMYICLCKCKMRGDSKCKYDCTENVSRRDGIRKYGKPKYEVTRVENVSMENSSTDMQGWNSTRLRKTQVHICRKRKYENGLTR